MTTLIMGCILTIKTFQLDRVIFIRDITFYIAAVSLILYIFVVPGRIRLQDSISLLGLYAAYVIVVMISKRFLKDNPLKSLRKYSYITLHPVLLRPLYVATLS